jgi:hypothetical protein
MLRLGAKVAFAPLLSVMTWSDLFPSEMPVSEVLIDGSYHIEQPARNRNFCLGAAYSSSNRMYLLNDLGNLPESESTFTRLRQCRKNFGSLTKNESKVRTANLQLMVKSSRVDAIVIFSETGVVVI